MVTRLIVLILLAALSQAFARIDIGGKIDVRTNIGSTPRVDTSLLLISTPISNQIIQRNGTNANIAITGFVGAGTHVIEARFNGGSWVAITTPSLFSYSGTLSNQVQGQGSLDVRWQDIPSTNASVTNFGIGDIFIIAGQSNAEGISTNYQFWTNATIIPTQFCANYQWSVLHDPLASGIGQVDLVSYNADAGGSVWPLVATPFMTNQLVPVAFVPCSRGGMGSTPWLPGANHQDRTTLYGSMVYRALTVGGCKAVLYWGGETDGIAGFSQATEFANLSTIANAIWSDLGVKFMPAKLQNCTGMTPGNQAPINAGIVQLWGSNTNTLTGPDLFGIDADDGFHLLSNAKLQSAATLWWGAVKTAFGW